MLVPQQLNIKCDNCCDISAIISRTNNNCSLFTIKEREPSTIITCYHCYGEMASIPHSMQMVKSQRKRYNNASGNTTPTGCFNAADVDKPNRYSQKMMNAIWGMYNKDSVHNFKSMACDAVTAAEIQAAAQDGIIYHGMLGELGRAVCSNFLENIYRTY